MGYAKRDFEDMFLNHLGEAPLLFSRGMDKAGQSFSTSFDVQIVLLIMHFYMGLGQHEVHICA